MLSLTLFQLSFAALLLAWPNRRPDIFKIQAAPEKVLSKVEFTYPGPRQESLDAPKVRPVNTTTLDWWYFSAISSNLPSDDLSSAVVTFYDATPAGFAALDNKTTKLEVSLTGSWPDGTPFGFDAFPAEAVVVSDIGRDGEGTVGKWGEFGSWKGLWLGEWEIRFADESQDVKGVMRMESIAPPHLPCGSPVKGATEELMPGIGWANAVPDARATVDFEIGGKELQFSGTGYHDKNWGSLPFFSAVSSWYWGHAHLGPYSIVWFDALDYQGPEYFSAYVARDNKIITSSCRPNSVTARPWGGEDRYPPPHNSKSPKGYEVVFADVGGKEMRVNVTVSDVTIPFKGVYDRYIGTAKGGFVGEDEVWSGVAEFEQFKV